MIATFDKKGLKRYCGNARYFIRHSSFVVKRLVRLYVAVFQRSIYSENWHVVSWHGCCVGGMDGADVQGTVIK